MSCPLVRPAEVMVPGELDSSALKGAVQQIEHRQLSLASLCGINFPMRCCRRARRAIHRATSAARQRARSGRPMRLGRSGAVTPFCPQGIERGPSGFAQLCDCRGWAELGPVEMLRVGHLRKQD